MRIAVRLANAMPTSIASRFQTNALVARLLRPLLNRMLPEVTTVISVRSGPAKRMRLQIYPRLEKFYWTGQHEREVQGLLTRLLEPGMVFWDVGAHIGFLSLLASRLVGAGGHVHAFEPMPANRARLERSVELNAASNVSVHPFAVGEASGTETLHPHQSSTMWSIRASKDDTGLLVDCRSLDDLSTWLGPPDVIKVDAEEAELDVLRGGMNLLTGGVRPFVIAERSRALTNEAVTTLLPNCVLERVGEQHVLLR